MPVPPVQCPNCAILTERVTQLEKRVFEKFDAQKESMGLALNASKEAVSKAETAADKRFEVQNELRGALNDLSGRMMLRVDYDQQHRALENKLDDSVRTLRDRIDGPQGLAMKVENLMTSTKGRDATASQGRQESQWVIQMWIVGGLAALALAVSVISMLRQPSLPAPVTSYVPQQYQQSLPVQPSKPPG